MSPGKWSLYWLMKYHHPKRLVYYEIVDDEIQVYMDGIQRVSKVFLN